MWQSDAAKSVWNKSSQHITLRTYLVGTSNRRTGANWRSFEFQPSRQNCEKAANQKCHCLLLLKRAGLKKPSRVMLYKSQILPTTTHSSVAWYPYTTDYQQKYLEISKSRSKDYIPSDWKLRCTISSRGRPQHPERNTQMNLLILYHQS